jgi:hypothetical protein
MPINPEPPTRDESDPVASWLQAMLIGDSRNIDIPFPASAAQEQGVLSWFAYELGNSQLNLMHLDCESELECLLNTAKDEELEVLAFMGHSVARTLYAHPACRITSDFDLLVSPKKVENAQQWLSGSGYVAAAPYIGKIWLGAQNWYRSENDHIRFAVDLHWDYTNRMYFRRRLGFDEIRAESVEVPCGNSVLHVPCPVDNLVIACIHLAAFDPGVPVRLLWLLDIYLLMSSIDKSEIGFLLERASQAHAVEACLILGEKAAELGDAGNLEPVLTVLRDKASKRRMRFYDWTLRWRVMDLMAYWLRLPVKDKMTFFADFRRWARVRRGFVGGVVKERDGG